MAEKSFSRETKDILSEIKVKKGCCRKTADMLVEALTFPEDFEKAAFAGERMMCRDCCAAFLRILFLKFGTVTDPKKSYHLEMSFPNELFRDYVKGKLLEQGLVSKSGKRRDRFTVYFKESVAIEDFLATVGAVEKAYDIMNLKLMKEMRGSINRQTNFETANMQKAINATRAYLDAISYLAENGYLSSMSDEMRETAELRLANDTASMSELGRLHLPPISKSGVKHRLDKILDFYEKVKNKHI